MERKGRMHNPVIGLKEECKAHVTRIKTRLLSWLETTIKVKKQTSLTLQTLEG